VFVNTEITGSDKHAKAKPNTSRGRGFGGDRRFPPRTNAVCVTRQRVGKENRCGNSVIEELPYFENSRNVEM
jgi:hypothetical protein